MSELARMAQEAQRQYDAGETEEGGFAPEPDPELIPIASGWSAKSKDGWSVRAATQEEAITFSERFPKPAYYRAAG